jgi:hypothetical protein
MKINSDMIKKMHQEAEKVYGPDLARVVKIQNNLALASCKPFDLKTSSLEKKIMKRFNKKILLCLIN